MSYQLGSGIIRKIKSLFKKKEEAPPKKAPSRNTKSSASSRKTKSTHSSTTLSFADDSEVEHNFTPRTGKSAATTTDYERAHHKNMKAEAQQQRRAMRKASVNANDKVGSWLAHGSSKKANSKKANSKK